jgi:hypothetical protein
MRQRKQQFKGGPPLTGFEPRQGALRDPGRRRDTGQGHAALGADSLDPRPDLLKGGGNPRHRNVIHQAHLTRISQKQQRS